MKTTAGGFLIRCGPACVHRGNVFGRNSAIVLRSLSDRAGTEMTPALRLITVELWRDTVAKSQSAFRQCGPEETELFYTN